ncbi:hypothetical protein [Cohaesibacter haloalkalitolerans]|uniref:hypothetical protein n=1 Tax=Cohaesibacter haloalkalitolerans TaxID=1162980 RepID=UPI000E646852|nr:hypothetical protein [Cohaesibacter haloalkalitolerans]
MSTEIKDLVYIGGIVVAVAGSHFMLRARVMVLEERIKGYSEAMKRIFESLSRIEEKLDGKADK